VNEFSSSSFPSAKFDSADVNNIVREAVEVFANADGISSALLSLRKRPRFARCSLAPQRDRQFIDNAAEALESSPVKNITVETRSKADLDSVEIIVADTGHGISPRDKDNIFLPHFSTKDRGTGLGLAIAPASSPSTVWHSC